MWGGLGGAAGSPRRKDRPLLVCSPERSPGTSTRSNNAARWRGGWKRRSEPRMPQTVLTVAACLKFSFLHLLLRSLTLPFIHPLAERGRLCATCCGTHGVVCPQHPVCQLPLHSKHLIIFRNTSWHRPPEPLSKYVFRKPAVFALDCHDTNTWKQGAVTRTQPHKSD